MGGVEGRKTMVEIYCTREFVFNKTGKNKLSKKIFMPCVLIDHTCQFSVFPTMKAAIKCILKNVYGYTSKSLFINANFLLFCA